MRADLGDPNDVDALARLRAALQALGAVLLDATTAHDVTVSTFDVGGRELRLFHDAWSVDAEGPDDLVQRLLDSLQRPA